MERNLKEHGQNVSIMNERRVGLGFLDFHDRFYLGGFANDEGGVKLVRVNFPVMATSILSRDSYFFTGRRKRHRLPPQPFGLSGFPCILLAIVIFIPNRFKHALTSTRLPTAQLNQLV